MTHPTGERQYTNGRIRVRPDQLTYLDGLLHEVWVRRSRFRAMIKAVDGADDVTELNRELRLIQSIQDEIKRTREDMGL